MNYITISNTNDCVKWYTYWPEWWYYPYYYPKINIYIDTTHYCPYCKLLQEKKVCKCEERSKLNKKRSDNDW